MLSQLTLMVWPLEEIMDVTLSGIDPSFDDDLLFVHEMIKERKAPFYFSPSFKKISRNPEKLFKVIDIVLRDGSSVVTINYYIKNGYIAKRKDLLRPPHHIREVKDKLESISGLRKTHREALQLILRQLNSQT